MFSSGYKINFYYFCRLFEKDYLSVSGKDLYQRVTVIFGGLMVFFYIGFGLFFILSPLFSHIDKVLRIIFGATFIIFGVGRAFRIVEKVREVFFSDNNIDD
jgi:cytochrome c biogenesis protein CcdA